MDAPVKVGFGKVVIAILCPPLYFFMRGRIVAGIIHSFLYLVALATLIFGIGVGFWLVSFVHAYWDLAHVKQEQFIQRHATVIAEKMVERRSV